MEHSTPKTSGTWPLAVDFIFALALLVGGIYLIGSGTFFENDRPPTLFYFSFYVLKILIELHPRFGSSISVWAYIGLLFCFAGCDLVVRGGITNGMYAVVYTVMWYWVPTMTFLYDLLNRPKTRVVLWRSVLEIVVLVPPWLLLLSMYGIYVLEFEKGIHI